MRVRILTRGWLATGLTGLVVGVLTIGEQSRPASERVRVLGEGEYEHPIRAVEFDPSGHWLASSDLGGNLRVWEVDRGRSLGVLGEAGVSCSAFAPEEGRLAWGQHDGTIVLWDLIDWREIKTFSSGTDSINTLAFSPDGRMMASGDQSGRLSVWEIESGCLRSEQRFPGMSITALAFSPDGQRLAMAGSILTQGVIRVQDLDGGSVRGPLDVGRPSLIRTIGFLPDGERLLWGDRCKGHLEIWESANEHARVRYPLSQEVDAFATNRDGTAVVLVQSDGWVELRILESLRLVRRVKEPQNTIHAMSLSPDGRRLAMGGSGESLKVWEF